MSREPDMAAVMRALSVTVQKQDQEIAAMARVLRWVADTADQTAAEGPVAILLAEMASRARLALEAAP